jgi:hypothetical protein
VLSILTKWYPIVLVTSVLAFGCCLAGRASARTFGGYDCTDDCVSHAAGDLWAEKREIDSIDDCPKNRSVAFYEGCLTYFDDPSVAPILMTTAKRSLFRSQPHIDRIVRHCTN